MQPEPPVCPMPAWMERALANDTVALLVRIAAFGAVVLIWGYLVLDLTAHLVVDALLDAWLRGCRP